ncbi:MAG: FprA family A-type flavoprotein [Bacteroidetes bacterium]|nr:FprA family A-type flavoprotein [Bacteroidota bacterium]
MEDKQVLTVTPDVHWVGVLDPDLIRFDVVMETKFGTTYNSYFIDADKKALVDTVKEPFWPVFLEKLKQLTDPAEIQYIIVNHTEPDHSGCLPQMLKAAPNATVVGSGNAVRYLRDQLGVEFSHLIVKDGDKLSLGNKTLTFIGAPNLHWPDTIFTWLEEDKLLFTCDAFGCHFSHPVMFDDTVGDFSEAFTFYFNVILKPYSKFVVKAIAKIASLPVYAICTGHGPILRKDWKKYVDLSGQLAAAALELPKKNRVLIAYVSAYRNTASMAERIADGIREAGAGLEVDMFDMEGVPMAEVERRVEEAGAVIVGSPIINQNILLQVYQLFAIMNPIRDRGKLAGAFGSYGWSAEFMKSMETNLLNLKLNFIDKGVFVRFTPHENELRECLLYGQLFGEKMLEEMAKCAG